MAQLVEQLLPTTVIHSLNTVICKFYFLSTPSNSRSLFLFLKKWAANPGLFLFIFVIFHYNFNTTNWKKRRWCAWDSNPGAQYGRHRWNHGAMVATQINYTLLPTTTMQRHNQQSSILGLQPKRDQNIIRTLGHDLRANIITSMDQKALLETIWMIKTLIWH